MSQAQAVQPGGLLQYAIPVAVFLVIFALRARRMSQLRPLKIEQLWIVPALYLVIVAVTFAFTPPSALGWGAAVLGLVIGGAIGWYRGKTVAIHVDPETHALQQRASPIAILILLALVLAKSAARSVGSAEHLDVADLTDLLLAMALGTFTLMRVEMYLRARRLLAEARARRAASEAQG